VFLSRPVFANIRNDATIKNNLAAFVQSFDTGTAPAVGYSATTSATNISSLAASNDWALLENQAAALTNIDLVAKGTIDGQLHGLLYQPSTGTYRVDSTNLSVLTHSQLAAKIRGGDRVTFTGVPPGTGVRMGMDRDEDGILDGDVPLPALQLALAGNSAIIRWPYAAAGFGLETATLLDPTAWSSATDPVEILSGQNFVTNTLSNGDRFYRLRFQP
jgi:hypothetical protein